MSRTISKSTKIIKNKKKCIEHHYVLTHVCKTCGWVKQSPKPDPPIERPEETPPGWGHGV